MKKNIYLLFFGIILSMTLSSMINTKQMKDKNKDYLEILAATRQLTELMINKDTTGISNIVSSNFTLTHITGYVQSKSEWFLEIETERMKYYSYEEKQTSVDIDGDKAYFISQNLLDARIWGSRHKWRLQQTMELEKQGGKWVILKSVATTF